MPGHRAAPSPGRRPEAVALGTTTGALVLFGVLMPLGDAVGTVRDAGVYPAVFVAGAVTAGLRAVRRGPVVPWTAMAVGLLLSAAASVYYSLALAPLDEQPYPSLADAGLLMFFPCAYLAVLGLLRGRLSRWRTSLALDGLLAALVAAAAATGIVLDPVLQVSGDRLPVVITNLAYPVGDLLLIAVLVAGITMVGGRTDLELALLLAGLTSMTAGDLVYTFQDSAGEYVEGGPLDLTWITGVTLIAAAAVIGGPRTAGTVADRRPGAWRLLLLPLVGAGCALSLLTPALADAVSPTGRWLAVLALVGASVRTAFTYRELLSLQDARRQASTDELTGLLNRRGFLLAAGERVRAFDAQRQTGLALLLMDLDGFKEVNDSLGHAAGDHLLIEIAARLRRALAAASAGADVLLARLGGDEFAALVPMPAAGAADAVPDRAQGGADDDASVDAAHRRDGGARRAAAPLLAALAEPLVVDGVTVHVDASIGIAVTPDHGHDLAALLRFADIAMYRAKSTHAGAAVHDPRTADPEGESRLERIAAVRSALARDEFQLYYQPKIALADGRVTGVEGLVRWHHPARGVRPPAEFLDLVDAAGLMPAMSARVLELAVAQAARWRAAGRPLTVAVNLPSSVVVDETLPDRVLALLTAHDLPPGLLQIEITEETLLDDRQRAREVLARLRSAGVRIAIDDYGVGYSSLAYLRELPVDELKLDRSFIAPISSDSRAAAIVRSTVDLAHSLGLDIVAEGVEADDAAARLAQYGCDAAQGFHYARPLPVAEIDRWLAARSAGPPPPAQAGGSGMVGSDRAVPAPRPAAAETVTGPGVSEL